MPITPATQKVLTRAMTPMWDSSDPNRNPAPLPPNPRDPTSPKAILSPPSSRKSTEGDSGSRESSPVRRGRTDSFGAGGPLPTLNPSPTRQPNPPPPGPNHKRAGSNQPSATVREKQNQLLNGGKPETTTKRHSMAANPRDLPGSVSTFSTKIKLDDLKLKDEFHFPKPVKDDLREYSSVSFRQSLDFDKTPSLPNLRAHAKTPDVTPPTTNSLSHLRMLTGSEFEDAPSKYTSPDFHTLTSQLTGLTTIASNLQREMNNLSRRSQDNARDLLLIREAAKSRDEEIRQSLRDLEKGLTSFEAADRLLGAPPARLSITAPSVSSGSESDIVEDGKLAPSTQALERLMREMPTKDDQERALSILGDIRDQLNVGSAAQKSHAEEKILSFLEDLQAKEEARGKQLIRPGAPREAEDEDRVLVMLEELRQDIQLEKPGEQKIMSILEEIKVKEMEARNDEKILSAISELKGKDTADDERLNHVVGLLEQIRDREGDEKVINLLQEAILKIEQMNDGLSERLSSISGSPAGDIPSGPSSAAYEDILRALDELKQGATIGSAPHPDLIQSLEDWKVQYEQNIGSTLRNLVQEVETLAEEQRATAGRLAHASFAGLPSQALTRTGMNLPQDLDNEAAITALANIASTTLRTDITMSSISALIKVFQKEQHTSSMLTSESLTNMGRYLEDIHDAMSAANVQSSDARKIMEVVRTHVCSSNDQMAELRDNTQRQMEEVSYLIKHLHRSIFGPEDEAPWHKDAGVKDDVEELTRKVDRLAEKNLQAWKKSGEDISNAISESNPASLIAELKTALGAMAQRSLETFKRSENEVRLLKEEIATQSERTAKIIGGADGQAEFTETACKTLSICEAIDKKIGHDPEMKSTLEAMKSDLNDLVNHSNEKFTAEASEIRSALESFKGELDTRIEDTIATAVAAASSDEKTAAALEGLKTEVSETLTKAVALSEKAEDSEKILCSLAELRKEVTELLDKSNSALIAPVSSPGSEEIKARIELLAKDLTEAMENISVTGSTSSSTEKLIKSVAESLRQEIEEMGTSIAAAVATGSASTFEEGIQKSLDEVKDTVLVKVERNLAASDKTIASIADLSKETQQSLNRMKDDVLDMINNSVAMAIAPRPQTDSGINKQLLDSLRVDIEDAIVSAVAAGTGTDELKEQIEKLRSDIESMAKKYAEAGAESSIKDMLESMKTDLASVVAKSASNETSTGPEFKASIEEIRKEIRELKAKNISAAPASPVAGGDLPASGNVGSPNTDDLFSRLKDEFNDNIELTLAAAIATSSLDTDQKMTNAIDDLKRDVKDTLEKAMVPFVKHGNEGLIREAMGALRQDFATMLEKRDRVEGEEKSDVIQRLDALKGYFGELLQMSSSIELKEAVDLLKVQIHGLGEKTSAAEFTELKEAIDKLKPGTGGADVSAVLEKLSEIQFHFGEILSKPPFQDANSTLASLLAKIQELIDRPSDFNLKNALAKIESRLDDITSKPSTSGPGLKEQLDAFKLDIANIAITPKDGDTTPIINSIKAEIERAIEKSTTNLSKFDDVIEVKVLVEDLKKGLAEVLSKTSAATDSSAEIDSMKAELKALIETSLAVRDGSSATGASSDSQLNEVKVALDSLKADIKLALEKTPKSVASPETPDGSPPALTIDPASVAEVGSAVGECRVEVAVVRTLVEEKAAETRNIISDIAKAHSETQGAITTISASLGEYKSDSMDGVAAIKSSIRDLSIETNGWITSVKTASLDSHEKTVADIKSMVNSVKDDTKECFGNINKAVDSAQADLKEAVAAVEAKVGANQSDIQAGISEIKTTLEQSKTDQEAGVATLAATIETSQLDTKAEITAVKSSMGEMRTANDAHYEKTQQQVDQVLSLVDGLSTEWKGQQPELFNALAEMKNLLLEAQKAATEKPEIELPPPYDDSQTQKKLDQLIDDHGATNSKLVPQLGLLETIQKQVSDTSASIAEFLAHQKSVLQVDSDAKARAAKECELELERAIAEKRVVESATVSLRQEHDKLQVSVELLKEDVEDMRTRKLRLTGELASLETALTLRREELMMLEARGEALERRMLEGLIEQSRSLVTKSSSRSYKKHKKSAQDAALRKVQDQPSQIKPKVTATGVQLTPGRRHMSLGQMNHSLVGSSQAGGGSLGLGQKEYTASLGLLGRSQSLKHSGYSTGKRNASMVESTPTPAAIMDVGMQYDLPVQSPVTEFIPEEEEEEDQEAAHEGISDDNESQDEVTENTMTQNPPEVLAAAMSTETDHEDDDIDHIDENDIESEEDGEEEESGVDVVSEEEDDEEESSEEEEEETDEEEEAEVPAPPTPVPAPLTVTKRRSKGFRPNPKYEEPTKSANPTRNVSGTSSVGPSVQQ
ncbi:hypothetical protein EX30DRAFT_348528 [Ascodesmis nigricans]|uniref:Uncharacterized protein n=1 Tax=Ascodesmis nigricans TaxID=341454 RepID=A0A4S2MYD5_9PEZI|nr:hypothetical protein EX30DRAFT_348528 [Ascodesmis nigricans]